MNKESRKENTVYSAYLPIVRYDTLHNTLNIKDFKDMQIGQQNIIRGGKDSKTTYTTTNIKTGDQRSGNDVKSYGFDADGNWYNYITHDDGRVYDVTTDTWTH